jgi:hypothetical protein
MRGTCNVKKNTEVPFCGYTTDDGYSAEECAAMNKDKGKHVAETILAQMGGGRALKLMLGVKEFSSHSDEGLGALSFRFKGSRKANYVKIILAPSDTYTLRFSKIGTYSYNVVEFVEDVYFDQLNDVFRRVTGLETRVPHIVGINT